MSLGPWVRREAGRLVPATLIFLLHLFLSTGAAQAELKIPVWAKDAEGNFLTEIPQAELRAWLEDEAVEIKSLHAPAGNLILLIVMDVVDDLIRIDAAREALVEALNGFGPREFAGLLRAQDGLQVVEEPTANREALKDSLLAMRVSGFPGLLESIEEAATLGDRMMRASDVRVAVLYITDGSIYEYRGDYTNPVINPSDGGDLSRRFRDRLIQEQIQRTLEKLIGAWTPLFFLHLENRRDNLNVVYQNGLTRFAQATAGEVLFCDSVAQIPTYLQQLIERIRSLHLLTVEIPIEAAGRVRLKVESESAAELIHREQFEIAKPDRK